MHNDEEATHATLAALLTDAVAPAIAERGGRVVKNTADGFLTEFPSADRYVLEGSVQRGGNLLRVNVQLVDAETGNHLWADYWCT